jgi:hypothetical protein
MSNSYSERGGHGGTARPAMPVISTGTWSRQKRQERGQEAERKSQPRARSRSYSSVLRSELQPVECTSSASRVMHVVFTMCIPIPCKTQKEQRERYRTCTVFDRRATHDASARHGTRTAARPAAGTAPRHATAHATRQCTTGHRTLSVLSRVPAPPSPCPSRIR